MTMADFATTSHQSNRLDCCYRNKKRNYDAAIIYMVFSQGSDYTRNLQPVPLPLPIGLTQSSGNPKFRRGTGLEQAHCANDSKRTEEEGLHLGGF